MRDRNKTRSRASDRVDEKRRGATEMRNRAIEVHGEVMVVRETVECSG